MKRIGFLLCLWFLDVSAVPARVMIIRHAEKDDDERKVKFGKWNIAEALPISAQGWIRAYAFVPFFTMDTTIIADWGGNMIKGLFAVKPGPDYESVREIQTLTPLSEKMNLPINADYALGDMDQMVNYILKASEYNGGLVIISYEHLHIPKLVSAFDKNNSKVTQWPHDVFDWIVYLIFDPQTSQVTQCEIKLQKLLYGDASVVQSATTKTSWYDRLKFW